MMRFSFLLRGAGWLPLLVVIGLLSPRAARASHALGSDLSYVSVGPGLYFVQLRFYRDCSGIPAPPDFALDYEATGCGLSGTASNSGGTVMLLPRSTQIGNPYCRQQNMLSPCDSLTSAPSNGLPNYQIFTYGGMLSLGNGPATECSAWRLSTAINARPNTRNLGFGTDLYTYALLNNRDLPDDSSPAFSTLGGLQPLAVIQEGSLVRYNSAVVDPNGDSLVYSMQLPLSGANTPIPYINGHTLQEPIRLQAGSAPLALDQQGTLTFTAGDVIGGTPNDEDNKFVVVIQVDAWRRINGIPVLTGRVRREVAAVIVATSTPGGSVNVPPAVAISGVELTYPSYTQTISYGDTVSAFVGEALQIDVPFIDAQGDSIFLEMPAALSPSGSTMTTVGYTQGPGFTFATARITWTPTGAHARSQAHQFYLRVRDNGCPNASSAFYPVSVIVAPLRPLGLPAGAAARQSLSAAPNPFSASTRLHVQASAADPSGSFVGIYDLTGRLLDRLPVPAGAGARELTWHAPAALPAGVYVARYQGATSQQTVRLVKE